jgi:hypothetical protein
MDENVREAEPLKRVLDGLAELLGELDRDGFSNRFPLLSKEMGELFLSRLNHLTGRSKPQALFDPSGWSADERQYFERVAAPPKGRTLVFRRTASRK